MDSHPIHLHGYSFKITGTDGGWIPATGQWPETTVNVPPGTTRDIQFVANAPGDWALHCHKNHHVMNAMNHDVPNMIGVNQSGVERKVQNLLPDYMAMGESGMSEMASMNMPLPKNTLPMMTGKGPFGPIEMGGMFTVLKVREGITCYDDPGWYQHPEGTVAWRVVE
ncbi:MAG: multicopper oxidase domain-containing protein, partial [Planctomycetes bacterium]|nr:multicopper oxidase domain-containing protein [Planctomycetota bacterium]